MTARPSTSEDRIPHGRSALLRVTLLTGCLAAVFFAAAAAQPSAHLLADADLALLLRGMALIKAALSLAALAVLLWRFGRPVGVGLTVSYLVGAWLVCGASMAIWQLAAVPLAAVLFHAGELTLLVAAWRDRRDPVRPAAHVRVRRPVVAGVSAPTEPSGMAVGRS
jgi:hypothetical protein